MGGAIRSLGQRSCFEYVRVLVACNKVRTAFVGRGVPEAQCVHWRSGLGTEVCSHVHSFRK